MSFWIFPALNKGRQNFLQSSPETVCPPWGLPPAPDLERGENAGRFLPSHTCWRREQPQTGGPYKTDRQGWETLYHSQPRHRRQIQHEISGLHLCPKQRATLVRRCAERVSLQPFLFLKPWQLSSNFTVGSCNCVCSFVLCHSCRAHAFSVPQSHFL